MLHRKLRIFNKDTQLPLSNDRVSFQISSFHAENRLESKKQPTTPEAQLVQYSASQQHVPSKRSISRNDPNMSLHPTEGQSSICMTLGDGNRVFVRQNSESLNSSAASSSRNSSPTGSTYSLGISMTDLIRRVQAIRRKKEHDSLKALSRELKQQRESLASAAASDEEEDAMEVENERLTSG